MENICKKVWRNGNLYISLSKKSNIKAMNGTIRYRINELDCAINFTGTLENYLEVLLKLFPTNEDRIAQRVVAVYFSEEALTDEQMAIITRK
jgi:hypothetical protein